MLVLLPSLWLLFVVFKGHNPVPGARPLGATPMCALLIRGIMQSTYAWLCKRTVLRNACLCRFLSAHGAA